MQSFTVTDQAEQRWLETAKLTITGPELQLIEEISSLIDPTPRAVKRFVNVYLLLKSVGRGRGWPLPERGQVALLLAIATGLPELADELLPNLAARAEAEPLTVEAVLPETAPGDAAAAQLTRLKAWLGEHPTWRHVALEDMDRWSELILRFRFHRMSAADSVHTS
ncbi:MAG: hypothetical protein M3308_07930 [Actinomycetota bacterium]|nr:hypothetical protein [Actinomycetota bacterium]